MRADTPPFDLNGARRTELSADIQRRRASSYLAAHHAVPIMDEPSGRPVIFVPTACTFNFAARQLATLDFADYLIVEPPFVAAH